MGEIVLLANPASGRGRGREAAESARTLLLQRGVRAEIRFTAREGHAVELAALIGAGEPDLLLVLGGDGTFRDVVAGLDGAPVLLGLLPAGTGNDLARCLGVPRQLPQALDAALSGRQRCLDVWRWNEALFVNVAGVGLDAAVAGAANRRFRRLRGLPAYLAAFASTLPGYQPFELALRWPEGEWSGGAWLAAFANGTCYGGGMRIAPAAVPDDGLLDVVVVEDVSKAELLCQFPRIFSGAHVKHPRVQTFRVETIEVGARPQPATIDGELIGSAPAKVERVPGRVRIRVP